MFSSSRHETERPNIVLQNRLLSTQFTVTRSCRFETCVHCSTRRHGLLLAHVHIPVSRQRPLYSRSALHCLVSCRWQQRYGRMLRCESWQSCTCIAISRLSRYPPTFRPSTDIQRNPFHANDIYIDHANDSTGSGEAFNVGQFLETTSPHAWALVGVGLNIGLSVIGAGWCVASL